MNNYKTVHKCDRLKCQTAKASVTHLQQYCTAKEDIRTTHQLINKRSPGDIKHLFQLNQTSNKIHADIHC